MSDSLNPLAVLTVEAATEQREAITSTRLAGVLAEFDEPTATTAPAVAYRELADVLQELAVLDTVVQTHAARREAIVTAYNDVARLLKAAATTETTWPTHRHTEPSSPMTPQHAATGLLDVIVNLSDSAYEHMALGHLLLFKQLAAGGLTTKGALTLLHAIDAGRRTRRSQMWGER